jgi:chromosome segregation and condensation protein ScpB
MAIHLTNLRNRRNLGTLLFVNKRRDAEHRRSLMENVEEYWTMYQREKMPSRQKKFIAHTPERLSQQDIPDSEEPIPIRPPMRFTRSIRTMC